MRYRDGYEGSVSQRSQTELLHSLTDFEAKATRVQNYEALFVPGLLHTAECTRAIIESVAPTVSEVELDNLVRAELRAHTQALNALRETQLEQGRKIDEQGPRDARGFRHTGHRHGTDHRAAHEPRRDASKPWACRMSGSAKLGWSPSSARRSIRATT